jgi:hypothetical protein
MWPGPTRRSPITAAHYRLCRAGTEECISGRRTGAGIAAVENLAVPSPGEWALRLWREDAAGNQQMANASEPVRLRFDPEPPQLGFETPAAEDPTRVSVLVTDRISGLGGGGIDQPSGVRHLAGSANQPGGRSPPRAGGRCLVAGGRLRPACHRARPSQQSRRHGSAPRRTADAVAAAAADRDLDAGWRRREACCRAQGQEGQEADRPRAAGQGGLREPSAPRWPTRQRSRPCDRRRDTATILPIEDTATLLAKASSTISVKPKNVLNGDSVTFSGRVGQRQ